MTSRSQAENEGIVAQAAAWHVASAQDDMDWDGFTLWLEADPLHRAAYDEIAMADALLDEHRAVLHDVHADVASQPVPHRARRWPWAAASALAVSAVAAIIALAATPSLWRTPETEYATSAAARTITLADGSMILLAPHSRLDISGKDDTTMRLVGGAFFTIRHDPARQLAIAAGPVIIHDIGTRFDVQADTGTARIAVSEGRLEASAPALSQPLPLTSGRSLLFDGPTATATLSDAALADIGNWRQGRLTYESTPLALVAEDIGRYAGIPLGVPGALRSRRFSGTLIIDKAHEAPRDLAQLMGLAH